MDRKQLIIEAATKSFSLFGYKATTMDQVAKLANVGKGTIYTFFKNKEELFDEIISTLIKEMKNAAESSFDSSLSFHENVHRALFKILEFRRKHQLTIKLFEEEKEMGTPAVMDVMEKMETAILNYIKEKVATAIESGEIKKCDPELTAFVMFKLYIALIFDWEKKHKPLEKEEIAELFEQYIFKGLSN
ncbi:TetR/AcrR family transcriptional regulator [Bacillus methanolicus]|uniref:Putative HTH-type transcriptional regulator YhgD n=1 Tax=Bacillus methanolicus (strain MGA3 / ATCC 53907) TaxID=796606 RepID=I3E7H3_BACMM|nr:TetR/AcrR family transcriptional regulator [Bacillus methanolicus]AIE59271.1 putative HTH-type transcriptional regulator YhgD [Bacillus methanolicus MGA3]EIJ82444.1 transcriptional regulator, TetR family [Bacillus methanolicus MGA3]